MKLINKDDLIVKIESLRRTCFTNFDEGVNATVQTLLETLDTLEVKEVQEEPVSEELEEEIIRYIGYPQEVDEDISTTMIRKAARHFAEWKKEQMMNGAVEGVVQDDFQVKLSDNSYIDLDPSMQRQPAFDVKAGERVKLKMFKEN